MVELEWSTELEDVIDVHPYSAAPRLVASRDFLAVFTGDATIRRRPMARVLATAAMGPSRRTTPR